ncbi:adhesin [Cronobacter phage vB_CsaM_GAP32]|uniref:Adhesin n=1 Tax=Cronobacter phage vB_CsaM_GAP32 TaxID=1141136 RepID=K4F7R4_9CAUD|nr:adhesin [Cronobacter phage vB_CsaM_GAP32]AFC21877.1 adhesin [Cronobacter phage vB_CsaM_GAP32]
MKKILIAVTFLGLSSTSFGATSPNDYKVSCDSVNSHASQQQWSQVAAELPRLTNALGRTPTETEMKACVGKSNWDGWQNSSSYVPTTPGGTVSVSKDDFKKDQDRQDANLDKETQDRQDSDQKIVDDQKNVDDAQNVEIGKKADQSALDQEVQDRKDGDKALSDTIDKNKSEQATKDGEQDQAITDLDKNKVNKDDQKAVDNAQNAAIGEKANQSDLDKEVANRTDGDKALSDSIQKSKDDQAAIDAAQNVVIDSKANQADLEKEVADRQSGDDKLHSQIDQNNARDDAQDVAINGKVDKSTYSVDKAKQAVHDAVQDAAIVGLVVTKADKAVLDKEVTARKDADKVLQSNIDSEAQTRVNADIALKNNIDQNKADQAKTDAKQDKALSTETDNRIAGDNALKANIDKNKADQAVTDSNQDKVITTKASKIELTSETASRKSADAKLSNRIDSNDATLVQHDQRITSNTQRIGSVEGRVSNLEQSTNKRFSDMDKRIGDNRKVASAGIAGAGAMANIPQVSQGSTFSVGAGVGGYDSEQAVAVGFSARVNNNVVTKMSVSTNTQSEVLWGAGVGVEW